MSVLSGFLPVEQGVACWAALRAHTDTVKNTGDTRSRDQIMADTLVERLTGQARAGDVHAEIAIVLPVDALTDPTSHRTASAPARAPARTPVGRRSPAAGPRRWPRCSATARSHPDRPADPHRLPGSALVAAAVHRPHGGIVGGDPTRRCFDGTLATLIGYRDGGRCREPFCDAPARHTDHIVPHRAGGPTTFTNGRATCVRSNQAREMPGWQVRLAHDGHGDHPHTVITVTPTGHTYTSRAGPAP